MAESRKRRSRPGRVVPDDFKVLYIAKYKRCRKVSTSDVVGDAIT
jgi:hypothetical protein